MSRITVIPCCLAALFFASSCSTFPAQDAEALLREKETDIRRMSELAISYDLLSSHRIHEDRWKQQVEARFSGQDFAGVSLLYQEWDSTDCDYDTERRDLIVTDHGRQRLSGTSRIPFVRSSQKLTVPWYKESIRISRNEVIYRGQLFYRYSYRFDLLRKNESLIYFFLGPGPEAEPDGAP